MSRIISSIIGKQCRIETDEFVLSDKCVIVDADDEWIKISYIDKKDISSTKIIRIDSIENIELDK